MVGTLVAQALFRVRPSRLPFLIKALVRAEKRRNRRRRPRWGARKGAAVRRETVRRDGRAGVLQPERPVIAQLERVLAQVLPGNTR